MIRAGDADLPAIRACLARRPELCMFPQSNLRHFGLDGDHGYAPSIWVARDGERVTDVLAICRNGTVMPYLPSEDYDAAVAILRGRDATAGIGPSQWVRPLLDRAGLSSRPTTLNRDEPQYRLDLTKLNVPPGPGTLRPLEDAGEDRMAEWYIAYDVEALGATLETARRTQSEAVRTYIAADSHRVLMDGDTPLCITGFNARLPSIVQVGGVYTPPAARGRGLARRAVALHLTEARATGVSAATLFAAHPAAARAYEAIGFAEIGRFTLCLFTKPERANG